ncbi:hypothetical protein DSECCO2_266330 [anaerobic digester metagenome]
MKEKQQKSTGINILQLEAKDILDENNVITFARYHKGTLDNSLEIEKLEDIHRKVYRNNKFTYLNKYGRWQTNDIISVRFRYSLDKLKPRDLRANLYVNGFYIEGEKFVRYKRSSGSSRIGNCLFIKEEMYKRMIKWSYMGLDDFKEKDLAGFETYIALTLSNIIGTIQIMPENILIIEDEKSTFTDKVIAVRQFGETLQAKEETAKITNDIWDGQSLLDSSMFTGAYRNKGFLLLRNQFFKSACFNTNIQQFFADNNITDISQLKGFTFAKDISDIKLITTPNSIKYLKFGTKEQWLFNLDSTFGVVKYEKPTHFFGGKMVQTHYQLLNTLEFSREEMEELLQPSFHYLRLLKSDLSVLRTHLKMMGDREYTVGKLVSSEDFILNMLQINDSIQNTKLFRDFINNNVTAPFRDNLLAGHVLISGNYSTLFSNGYEMLQHSIGLFADVSLLAVDSVICKNFTVDEELLCCRSPHITMGNLWVVKNVAIDEYNRYFNLSKEIICVNSIGSNHMQRLNGADYDSDTVLITNEKRFVDKAKKNYREFLVPTGYVGGGKKELSRTSGNLFLLDDGNANNKIGEIINFSQCLNSLLWERKKQGLEYQDVYKDICILAALSGVEIDKAKKDFGMLNNIIIHRKLNRKYKLELKQKPIFLQYTESNIKRETKKYKYRCFETSMDYLVGIVPDRTRKIEIPRVKNRMDLLDFLVYSTDEVKTQKANTKSMNKILTLIEECDQKTKRLWGDLKGISKEEKENRKIKYQEILDVESDYRKELSVYHPKVNDLKFILRKTPKGSVLKTLSFLYELYPQTIKELFWTKKEDVMYATPCEKTEAEYYIYNLPYRSIQKQLNVSMGEAINTA